MRSTYPWTTSWLWWRRCESRSGKHVSKRQRPSSSGTCSGARILYHAAWQELEELMRRESADQQADGRSADTENAAADSSTASEQPESATPPGWYPDPSGRHLLRWFDGDWTAYASNYGAVVEDPNF